MIKKIKEMFFLIFIFFISLVIAYTITIYVQNSMINNFESLKIILLLILIDVELVFWSDILTIEKFGSNVIKATVIGKIVCLYISLMLSLMMLPIIYVLMLNNLNNILFIIFKGFVGVMIVVLYFWINSLKIRKKFT